MKTITDPSLLDEALRRALAAAAAAEGEPLRFVHDAVEQAAESGFSQPQVSNKRFPRKKKGV